MSAMDRTTIWKAEERDASEKLCKKLEGLTMIFPASETLRNLLSDTMFLKPNPQAFFHVMHYLFCILDPNEFKKRFYWPITDKRAEASFRSASVEYLKHLNEKHQLQWSTSIKSYLVVMPGGMKFITFMLEFVGFVVQEMVQIREKQLSNLLSTEPEFVEVSQSNLLRMRRQNTFLKEYASNYVEEIDAQMSLLRSHTHNINQKLLSMAQSLNTELEVIISENFLDDFEKSNCEITQLKFCDPMNNVRLLETPLLELTIVLEQFMKIEKDIHYDRDQAKEVLHELRQIYPTQIPPASSGNHVNLHTLLAAFNCMHNTMDDALTTGEQQFQHIGVFKDNRLFEKSELDKTMAIATGIQQKLKNYLKIDEEKKGFRTPLRNSNSSCSATRAILNTLLEKFVSTPPIMLDMQGSVYRTNRLALLEDHSAKMLDQPLDSLLVSAQPTSSARKPQYSAKQNKADQSCEINNTATNRSGIIDAMQLLRTIKKDSTTKSKVNMTSNVISQHNFSRLSEKWKERQCLLSDVIEQPALVTPQKQQAVSPTVIAKILTTNRSPLQTSPFTPFNSNDSTRIARQQLLEKSMSEGEANVSQHFDTQSLAVRKVRDDSLKMLNLSTSPSGRLAALLGEADLPKLQINDETLLETDMQEATEVLAHALGTLHITSDNIENIENNVNLSNQMRPRLLFSGLLEEDALANISDSVLNDVSI